MIDLPTIQELRSFIIYGEVHNFSLAAKKANITQSAFSAQIKKLENIVGVPLIQRTTQGSSLTREGEIFLKEAEKIIKSLEQLTIGVRKSYENQLPALHIGVLRSIGDVLMNQHIANLQKRKIDFSLKVYDMEEAEIILDLKEDRIDMATLYISDDFLWQDYQKVPFTVDKFVYYAPNYKLKGTVKPEQIWENTFLTYPPKYMMSKIFHDYFQNQVDLVKHTEIQLSNPYAMINFCEKNRAGCLISERLANFMGIRRQCNDLVTELSLQAYIVFKDNTLKYDYIKTFISYLTSLKLV